MRTPVKSAEAGDLIIEKHETCCRARLNAVLVVVDCRTLKVRVCDQAEVCLFIKAVIEFRRSMTSASCRFCSTPLGMLARTIINFDCISGDDGGVSTFVSTGVHGCCIAEDCVELAKNLCTKTLDCGHACNGVRDEDPCLPCLKGCAKGTIFMDSDDLCPICFTSSLSEEPCIVLDCRHVFHFRCISRLMGMGWSGPRITFGYCRCPTCSTSLITVTHPRLAPIIAPVRQLYEEVCGLRRLC